MRENYNRAMYGAAGGHVGGATGAGGYQYGQHHATYSPPALHYNPTHQQAHYDYPHSPTSPLSPNGHHHQHAGGYMNDAAGGESWGPFFRPTYGPQTTTLPAISVQDQWSRNHMGYSASNDADDLESRDVISEPEEIDIGQPSSSSHKKYRCPKSGCLSAFARKADRDRHYECVHNKSENKKFPCEVSGCNRVGDQCFTRKDHLVEHLRNYHRKDIPKRKTHRRNNDGDDDR